MIDIDKAVANTHRYYQEHAEQYCAETYAYKTGDLYPVFLARLPDAAHILDAGCGSGRDSKFFIEAGFQVTCVDACAEVAARAQVTIGHPVQVKSFQQIDEQEVFDAIWANASLLHCPKDEIPNVFNRLICALKSGGYWYLSFKWGVEESTDNRDRYFNNYTTASLREVLGHFSDISILDIWETVGDLRGAEQRWVCGLVKKL